ncbi:AAA family ATPase [Maridesulfovibrio salexigens]|uniref:Kinase n=1 Tax=Maridesulfovibrio salexigens (strain ATCC 14822 / DSM 2638 / NCIMB 8403 / VKM B-1763) TaxID=526222 RepID=C6C1Y5_MARSD|nr:AAA family ATPase [Maridesulfovibrio salexigens]ACS79381.1 kinase [Maridesulfovibrio salexigens DSM 2638]
MGAATLYIFSGLPGSGKSTLAQGLSTEFNCAYLRIDTIEQAMRDLCNFKVEGEGYRLAYRIASDNLKCGVSVVSDSCNPIELTRTEWQKVAISAGARFINIEVICSDKAEHKKRVEKRTSTVAGLKLPKWEQVEQREYHAWKANRIVVDTAGKTEKTSIQELISSISKWNKQI